MSYTSSRLVKSLINKFDTKSPIDSDIESTIITQNKFNKQTIKEYLSSVDNFRGYYIDEKKSQNRYKKK